MTYDQAFTSQHVDSRVTEILTWPAENPATVYENPDVRMVGIYAMPARRPKHTWAPPATTHRPVQPTADTTPARPNHHARRIARRNSNGWH